jgi:lysophospholipase L1-like esterase
VTYQDGNGDWHDGPDVRFDVSGSGEAIHFIGRFDTSDPAGPRFAWPGSAIAARFSGTGIDIALTDPGGNNYWTVRIDGMVTTLQTSAATTTYTLASGLPNGNHDLVITKRTESFVGVVQFKGLTPKGGAIVPTPFPSNRRIEMIGDSITCGYGVLGPPVAMPTCGFTPATENEDQAWGAIAAMQLSAVHTTIAYSGRGMYRNNTGQTTDVMPDLWLRTFADDPASTWDFSKYTPDVVVIDLGTNDFATGDPGSAYTAAYSAFLKTLRGKYPNAFIICALGTMGDPQLSIARGYISSAVMAAKSGGDSKVSFLEMPTQDCNVDGCGCDYHPDLVTQSKMGAALAQQIRNVAGW